MTATETTLGPAKPDLSKHPCFNEEARCSSSRIHLPVAPRCNVQCNFCDRQFSCANESRPGVTAAVLSPRQALERLRETAAKLPNLSVVGIAGPGDPFANPQETLETLRLVRAEFPGMMLCVATNGLNLMPYVDELAALAVSHVTITINAVDPEIGRKVYSWMRYGKGTRNGLEAAEYLMHQQLNGLLALKARGILAKVNSIAIPGVNLDHIPQIARTVAAAGADILNIIPLLPVAGTPFGTLAQPEAAAIEALRADAAPYVDTMNHCSRCRADAIGLLGENQTIDQIRALQAESAARPAPAAPATPAAASESAAAVCTVAVATMEGLLVNQHLGEAEQLTVYRTGPAGVETLGSRPTPPRGGGDKRWRDLAAGIADCDYLLVAGVGQGPQKIIASDKLKILVVEGLIEDALAELGAGRVPERMVRQAAFSCGSGCGGTGNGCG